MERGGLKKGSITKIRHVLAADRSPMNVGNGLDSSLSSKSDSELEHSVLQSSTPTRQVRTYFNKLQSKNAKAFMIFSCEMHVLVSCGDWVIAEKFHTLTTVPKTFIFHCPKHGIGFFLRGCPMHTLGRKPANGCRKDNAKIFNRSLQITQISFGLSGIPSSSTIA